MVPATLMLGHELPEGEQELLASWLAERRGGSVAITVPKRGRKRELVAMVAKSAEENLEQSRLKFLSDEQRMTAAMTELAAALDLPRLPRRIECFDISNLHGTNPVASMIVFQDGRPAKKEYRRFSIKTVEGSNDFAMMREVISRRFRRAADADDSADGKWSVVPDLGHRRRRQGTAQRVRRRTAGGWLDRATDRGAGEGKRGALRPRQPSADYLARGIPRRCSSCSACATKRTASPSPFTVRNGARRRFNPGSTRYRASVPSGSRHSYAILAR